MELINIPLNITDDMLLGGIDIETTIKAGSKVLSKSLLERAKHNIIYIDDINLSEPKLSEYYKVLLEIISITMGILC